MKRLIFAAAILAIAAPAAAQATYRLKGLVNDSAGAPVDGAKIRMEAIYGFRGSDQFAGQRTFEAKSNKKGEWSVLGLTSGLWLFTADAPNHLPQSFALPVNMVDRGGPSGAGSLLPWMVEFTLTAPGESTAPFAAAVKPAFAGKKEDVFKILSPALESNDPALLVAAGELLLVVKEPVNAEKIFARALRVDAANWRANLGAGSSALLRTDWTAGTKGFWAARDGAPDGFKQAISAAIADLQKIVQTR